MIRFLASPPSRPSACPSSPPCRPCVPTLSTTHPPVRSLPLPCPAVCDPHRSTQRPSVRGKTGEGRQPRPSAQVRSLPGPCPAVCVPHRSTHPLVRSHPLPCPAVCVPHRPTVSESRIKRITQITRITPHIPTAALSFPSAMSFACPVAIDLSPRPPLFASLIVGCACAYNERGSTWLFEDLHP